MFSVEVSVIKSFLFLREFYPTRVFILQEFCPILSSFRACKIVVLWEKNGSGKAEEEMLELG